MGIKKVFRSALSLLHDQTSMVLEWGYVTGFWDGIALLSVFSTIPPTCSQVQRRMAEEEKGEMTNLSDQGLNSNGLRICQDCLVLHH